jgi:hypothetical protein
MLYNSNFDDSSFKSSTREFNKTIYDPCETNQRNSNNNKKMKYITTNHVDLLEAKDKLNFYGMTIRDQLFVPSNNINEDSFLRYGKTGGIITNANTKNVFGQLPLPTMPAKYQTAHGDVEIEDKFVRIPLLEVNKQSCNPKESNYHNRSFYIFDDSQGIDTPNAGKSVEGRDFGPRGGINSRFISK